MGRVLMGGATVVFACILGSSAPLEGQSPNDGWGPTAIIAGTQQETFSGDVTSSGSFWWRLKIDYNGSPRYTQSFYVSTSGGTVPVSRLVTGMNTWGLSAGNHLDCKATAWYWLEWWGNSKEWDSDIEQS